MLQIDISFLNENQPTELSSYNACMSVLNTSVF